MTQEQKALLTYIHYTLEMNVNDKSKTYEYSIEEAEKVTTLEVDREEHLEEIMRWALQELEKHFELIPEPKIDQCQQSNKQFKGGVKMFKKKRKNIDLSLLTKSSIKEIRLSIQFLQLQKFLIENKISEEDCKVLARMLNAYYNN